MCDGVGGAFRAAGDSRTFGPCRTVETPLPGGRVDPAILADRAIAQNGHRMSGPVIAHLAARYGERLADVLSHVQQDSSLAAPVVPTEPDARAEVAHAVEHEFAMTLEDVLIRRTQLGLVDASGSATAAPEVARVMATRLGWDEATAAREAAAYAAAVASDRERWG
jgi:glycerol-3-phosphate dehydrogenase